MFQTARLFASYRTAQEAAKRLQRKQHQSFNNGKARPYSSCVAANPPTWVGSVPSCATTVVSSWVGWHHLRGSLDLDRASMRVDGALRIIQVIGSAGHGRKCHTEVSTNMPQSLTWLDTGIACKAASAIQTSMMMHVV